MYGFIPQQLTGPQKHHPSMVAVRCWLAISAASHERCKNRECHERRSLAQNGRCDKDSLVVVWGLPPIDVIYIGCGPLPVTVANEGLWGFPTTNVRILVVTVTQCILPFLFHPLGGSSQLVSPLSRVVPLTNGLSMAYKWG